MNLSIFDNDGTLGDASGFHDVHVRVNGSRPAGQWIFPNWNPLGLDIANQLANKLWAVLNVTSTGGTFDSNYTFDIHVRVHDIYDDETVKSNMVRDLNPVFHVSGISIIASGPRGTSSSSSATSTGTNSGTSTSSTAGTPNAGLPAATNPGTSGTNLLGNFATGLGISTPVALLGGAVLLILIARK